MKRCEMEPQVKLWSFLLLVLAAGCSAKQYRFDYEWSAAAGGWLKYHVVPSTWEEARMICHAEGAVLASPLNNQLKEAVITFVKNQKNCDLCAQSFMFTGVHAIFSKGVYASIEGTPLSRLSIDWQRGEPDNYDNSEDCLVVSIEENGTMADMNCGRVFPYVCYKKDTALTVNTACGTTDPAYRLESSTGSCYKLHSSGLLWSQAYMTCMAEGGYLAIMDNQSEVEVAKNIFKRHPADTILSNTKDQFMIGVHGWSPNSRNFMTIHGEDLQNVHHRWATNSLDRLRKWESAPPGSTLDYNANMYRSSGNMVANDNVPLAFLCEKDPKISIVSLN